MENQDQFDATVIALLSGLALAGMLSTNRPEVENASIVADRAVDHGEAMLKALKARGHYAKMIEGLFPDGGQQA